MSTHVEYVGLPDEQTSLGTYLAIDTGEHEETESWQERELPSRETETRNGRSSLWCWKYWH